MKPATELIAEEQYNPKGLEILNCGKHLKLVQEGPWNGWICYKHPDGQWVSLRRATGKELAWAAEIDRLQGKQP